MMFLSGQALLLSFLRIRYQNFVIGRWTWTKSEMASGMLRFPEITFVETLSTSIMAWKTDMNQ